MDFRVLGPLEIRDDSGVPRQIPAGRLRTLCTALLLSAGTVVSADSLAADVWDEAQPDQPHAALLVMVARLRKALGPEVGARIRTVRPGYLFATEPGELDLHTARRLCALGRGAHGRADWPETVRLLDQALALWRGEPLDDVPHGLLTLRAAGSLEELRTEALRQRFDALLALGRHEEAVGELTAAVQAWPLREQFRAQLILARYRSGRRAEALAAYQDCRKVLIRDLGVEPGAKLVALHQAVLVDDPALAWHGQPPRQEGVGVASPVRQAVSQLPTDIADFTGRDAEVARLLAFAGPDRAAPGVAVATIHGMAGVGKTALAVRVAHLLAGAYPDGQFFLDLHAHSPDSDPVPPAKALDRLLRAWGIPADRIPDSVDERSAAWRSELSGHRVLILLDNTADLGQVRPLLPGGAGSLVIVTGRTRLLLDGAHSEDLEVLSQDAATSLFCAVAGDLSRTEPEAVAEAVALCGFLPLAIRIAAARLRARPHWTVAHLGQRLADQRRRLSELTVGDRDVAAAFGVSYRHLTEAQRHLFRLLGRHPGADFEAGAAAALAGVDVATAEAVLEQLVDANLLQQRSVSRYSFHDLVRDHARSIAADNGTTELTDAVTRLFDHYRWAASEAIEQVMPLPTARRPKIARPPGIPATFAGFSGPEPAEDWLRAECQNLLAVGKHSAAADWPGYAGDLSDLLWRYLLARGLLHESVDLHESAVLAARRTGDTARLVRALRGQGNAWLTISRYDAARAAYLQALEVGDSLGDVDTARTLNNLGSLGWRTGDLEEAAEYLRKALRLYLSVDDVGAATAAHNLGGVCFRLGRYAEATEYVEQALALHTDSGSWTGQCDALILMAGLLNRTGHSEKALDHLDQGFAIATDHRLRMAEAGLLETRGVIYGRLGRHREAIECLQRCLELSREAGYQIGQAYALTGLGTVHYQTSDLEPALAFLEEAESLARSLGERIVHADALNALGAAKRSAGRLAEAVNHHEGALELARATGDRYEQARAHQGSSQAYADLGQSDSARDHAARARMLFEELGVPASVSGMARETAH